MKPTASTTPSVLSDLGLNTKKPEAAPWNIVALLTILTFLPALLLCVTPFARLLVIFHFLRQALGTQMLYTQYNRQGSLGFIGGKAK